MNMGKVLYPQLSYTINGILFRVHNELGRFCREKEYCDLFEKYLKDKEISYKREAVINFGQNTNRVDFIVENSVVLEFKAKRFVAREDYFQIKRYLEHLHCSLGILVNFQNKFLTPKRVLNGQAPD